MDKIIEKIKPTVMQVFDYLHQHPEISWQEVKTTEYIANTLRDNGWKVTNFDDCTGVIGEVGSGKPVVAVRADMDALWQEVNGTFCANHSCGHDAHMSIVLGVMFALKELNYEPAGKIKLIFQPAEEKGTGALKLVEKGVIDDVDFLYGVHLRPFQELDNGYAVPAIHHGAARFINGKIKGADVHGARPHLGANAIEVGAELVSLLKGIHLDPMVPYSVKVTKFMAGGDSANIIPGNASFSLDLRAQSNVVMNELSSRVEKIASTLANHYDVDIQLSQAAYIAAAEVNAEATEMMSGAIKEVLGEEKHRPPIITTGGDDFHFYTLKRPHLKATMLGLGCDLKPGLHHPHMTFEKEAIFKGVEILTNVVVNTMNKLNNENI
ncbi:M20 peptidase aminoacylase family protein [Alkalihalobacterium chitinilyticum]|uniref:M20 peptidase aminoacylase family protein n=1 Tax=Alkalihalobacterium chitinilyticum TaxID=2980103 RepID=A0ABT5VGQ9_9BACI|nr:M20 peptidase aminoacylase family protein [Alkalihalobacterium chitinilyticum]MDE5413384.1 M20 peptidase aminoacylase family protein [Alkalihalobacterium chitinilyticum]